MNSILPVEGSASTAIATVVKSKMEKVSLAKFNELLKKEYVKLHLLDRNGQWMLPEVQRISDVLIPPDLSMNSVNDMIDTIANNMEENPYMMDFLNAARGREFPALKSNFLLEGDRVIPMVVAAAYAMEQVTKAELNDPSLVKALTFYWEAERKRAGVSFQQTGIFGIVKLMSVEQPIRKIVEFHGGKTLDPAFLRGFLSLNIFEAITADKVTHHPDNAEAGWPLYNNQAGDSKVNPKLDNGPASFSEDKKKILIRYALPKQWNDLYQVWNMAFVSQIGDYPTWIIKLLIPQMSGYKAYPTEYIYRRALTLYTALHYSSLSQIENAKDGIKPINWRDDELTQLWGKINRASAKDYQQKVDSQKK